MYHERSKHIDVKFHFVRQEGIVEIKKIATADNPADMLTKPLPTAKLNYCVGFGLLLVYLPGCIFLIKV